MNTVFSLLLLFINSVPAFAGCSITSNVPPGEEITPYPTEHINYELGTELTLTVSCPGEPVNLRRWWWQGPEQENSLLPETGQTITYTVGEAPFNVRGFYHIHTDTKDGDYNYQYAVHHFSVLVKPETPVIQVGACTFDSQVNANVAHVHINTVDNDPQPNGSMEYRFYSGEALIGIEAATNVADGTYSAKTVMPFGSHGIKVRAVKNYFSTVNQTNIAQAQSEFSNAVTVECYGNPPTTAPDGSSLNSCNDKQPCGGKPVNLSTGAHWHQNPDFYLPGRTLDTALDLTRTYVANSELESGDFGPNWSHPWETKLIENPDLSLTWVDEFGGSWLFRKAGVGAYLTPGGLRMALYKDGDHLILSKQDTTKYRFDLNGRILQFTDRFNESINFSYDGEGKLATVSTALGGVITLTRDTEGSVSSVKRERDNLTYNYEYNAEGRLSKVTDFSGLTYEYTYVTDRPDTEAQGKLATIKDPLGRVVTTFYTDDGRVSHQVEPGGATRYFTYTNLPTQIRMNRRKRALESVSSTTFQDIDGTTTTYQFDENYRWLEKAKVDGGRILQEWSPYGFPLNTQDELGHVTQYSYDTLRNLRSIKRGADSMPLLISYHPTYNLPIDVTRQGGWSIDYVLDVDNGALKKITRTAAGGASLETSYTNDIFGNPVTTNNGRAIFSNQRDANGLLTQVYDARNPETRTYDSRHRVSVRTFQNGRVLTYGYDDYDRVTSVVDNSGPDALFTYDAMGKILSQSVVSGATFQNTSYTWDEHDRIRTITDAAGRITRYSYAANRVLPNPESITDPAGRVTKFEYDSMGRRTKAIDPKGAVTSFTYNQRGDLTSVTDDLGNVTSYEYDGNGRVIVERRPSILNGSPHAREITYTYNDEDQVTQETHIAAGGENRVISYEYDGFNRLVKKTLKKGNTVEDEATYAYEAQADANLLTSANNNAANLSFSYEASPPFAMTGYSVSAAQSGNPLGLIEDTFTITRDATSNIAGVTGANSGKIFTKSYDPAGRLVGFSSGTFKGAIQYDGFGRKENVSYSDGTAGRIAYDSLNRITHTIWQQNFSNSVEQHLTYNPAGNVSHIGREHSTYDLTYDPADQLIQSVFQGLQGVPEYNKTFGYDPLGNAISGSRGAGTFVSNFLTQNGTSSFVADPDAFGEIIKEITGDQVKNYTYRADGRISGFQSGNLSVNYFYDGLDRLVAMAVNKNGTQFTISFVHLGLENRILMAKAGDGTITTYLDGQGPNEHLGEVRNGVGKAYITDNAGSVLNSPLAGDWKTYGLMGEVNGNVTISPSMSPVMYAWQGLRYDPFTGRYDNLARQYNQNTGTFTSQDPSGLRGGMNLYGSRRNNPIRYSDPNGENPLAIAGAIIGAGINAYQAYQAGGTTRQIVLSAGVGAVSGGLAGLTGGLGLLSGAAGAFSAGYFNNAANQLIFTGDINSSEALTAGAVSAGIGAVGYGVTSVSNRYVYEIFSEGAGFTAGTTLEMFNNGGIPKDPRGNKLNQCP